MARGGSGREAKRQSDQRGTAAKEKKRKKKKKKTPPPTWMYACIPRLNEHAGLQSALFGSKGGLRPWCDGGIRCQRQVTAVNTHNRLLGLPMSNDLRRACSCPGQKIHHHRPVFFQAGGLAAVATSGGMKRLPVWLRWFTVAVFAFALPWWLGGFVGSSSSSPRSYDFHELTQRRSVGVRWARSI